MPRSGRGRGRALAGLGGGTVPPQALTLFGTPILTGRENAVYTSWQVTASGGTAPYTYALVGTYPAGISIDVNTGIVSGTPTEDGSFASLNVEVTDGAAGTDQLNSNFTLVIGAELSISGTPDTDIWENEAYGGFDVDATGGATPYVFSLQGTWPSGISINSSSGVVSGTPTEFGSFPSLTVRVTDNEGSQRSLSTFTLDVGQELDISGTPNLTGEDAQVYDDWTASGIGGDGDYTFSLVGTWPTGITVDPDTGVVSGTPTEDGSFPSLSIRVTDGRASTADLPTFTLVIDAAPAASVIVPTAALASNSPSGGNFTFTAAAIGTAAADRWVVVAASIPATGVQEINVTIDGTTMIPLAQTCTENNARPVYIGFMPWPSNTTADIVIVGMGGTPGWGVLQVAAVYGMADLADLNMSIDTSFPETGSIDLVTTVDAWDNGALFGMASAEVTSTPGAYTWSGVTALTDITQGGTNVRAVPCAEEPTVDDDNRAILFDINSGGNVFYPGAAIVSFADDVQARLFHDNFNRANNAELENTATPTFSALGSTWTKFGNGFMSISSNEIHSDTTVTTYVDGYIADATLGQDAFVEIRAPGTIGSTGGFFAIRAGSGGTKDDFLGIRVFAGNANFIRLNSGSQTTVIAQPCDGNDKIRLEAIGTNYRFSINGKVYSSGAIGGAGNAGNSAIMLPRFASAIPMASAVTFGKCRRFTV